MFSPSALLRCRLLVIPFSLLLTAPSAAASTISAANLAEFGRRTQALGSRAADAVLDKAADYWFTADKKEGRPLAGSGPALAIAIRLGRTEALRSGASPLPSELKRAFRRHYSSKVLNSARWMVAAPGSRLGQLLARWPVREGAVTLGEIIVFKSRRAAGDRGLFAHELAHVDQYQRLGIDRFANRYAANRTKMEEEARAKARRAVLG
jgi:Tfp pilus assembly protein FimT